MIEFCKHCGEKKTKEWTGKYNNTDGEKEYRLICPDKPCQHSDHILITIKKYGIFRSGLDQCVRCKETFRTSSPDW